MTQHSKDHHDLQFGWITAIRIEYLAACALLDEEYGQLPSVSREDNNSYTFGHMGRHDVATATLPTGRCGLTSAANVANLALCKDNLRLAFIPYLKLPCAGFFASEFQTTLHLAK